MDMAVGNRQPGVHTHTIDEIYVILEGHCESFDGLGNTHIAGPLDCLYIPKGVPHGVRTIGDVDLRLLWVNDDIERWGVSVYAEGPGPYPAAAEVGLIPMSALDPTDARSINYDASTAPLMTSWVDCPAAGIHGTPGVSAHNARLGLGLTVLPRRDHWILSAHPTDQLWVVGGGRASVRVGGRRELVETGDALFCSANSTVDIEGDDDGPAQFVRMVQAPPPIPTRS